MTYYRNGEMITGSAGRDLALMKTDFKGLAYNYTDSEETYMRQMLSLSVGELVYGMGERFTPFVKNGQSVDIWNADGGTSTEQSYKNIPFYLTNKGYGVLVNHSEKVSFEVATEMVTRTEFSVEGGYLDQICQGKYYNMPEELKWKDMEDKYQNPQRIVDRYRYFCQTHAFLGESFPNLNIDFGPGSLASYLGSEIGFKEDTVWFNKCLDGWDGVPKLTFDPENKWFKKHLQLAKDCQALAGDDFYVDMPDLMENIDVLASLRGAQDILFDLLDEPEMIGERIQEVTDIYYEYYDRFYDVIKDEEGGNAYTVFQIWGPGRTVKLQCDFSAMMSPEDFRKYIQPSLRSQSENVDHVLYHLDGPAAIKHMDALMEIEGIDALQWTSGDAGPDGTLPDWDVIYDKAIAAGKSIWVKVYSGEFEDWIRNVDRIVNKYGSHSLFLLFPEMSMEQAAYLLDYADRNWSDVKGTFVESLGR